MAVSGCFFLALLVVINRIPSSASWKIWPIAKRMMRNFSTELNFKAAAERTGVNSARQASEIKRNML